MNGSVSNNPGLYVEPVNIAFADTEDGILTDTAGWLYRLAVTVSKREYNIIIRNNSF